ncbi:MAG: hypothetical protein WC329_06250 [Candidatus Omnitrophota bacterium]|jgi:hypothetical protein
MAYADWKDIEPQLKAKEQAARVAKVKADQDRRRAMVDRLQRKMGRVPVSVPATVEGLTAMASSPAQAARFEARRAMVNRVLTAALGHQ